MNQDKTVGPVNIGNPGEFTMLELAELVLKKVGGKSKVTNLPLPADDPKQRRPDISLLRKPSAGSRRFRLRRALTAPLLIFVEHLRLSQHQRRSNFSLCLNKPHQQPILL